MACRVQRSRAKSFGITGGGDRRITPRVPRLDASRGRLVHPRRPFPRAAGSRAPLVRARAAGSRVPLVRARAAGSRVPLVRARAAGSRVPLVRARAAGSRAPRKPSARARLVFFLVCHINPTGNDRAAPLGVGGAKSGALPGSCRPAGSAVTLARVPSWPGAAAPGSAAVRWSAVALGASLSGGALLLWGRRCPGERCCSGDTASGGSAVAWGSAAVRRTGCDRGDFVMDFQCLVEEEPPPDGSGDALRCTVAGSGPPGLGGGRPVVPAFRAYGMYRTRIRKLVRWIPALRHILGTIVPKILHTTVIHRESTGSRAEHPPGTARAAHPQQARVFRADNARRQSSGDRVIVTTKRT
jgi:hypothetical protein